jgi:hypothetical protein
VRLALHWIGRDGRVFYAPDIPPLMEAAARAAHAAYVGPDEEVLVLHDTTLLGSGENGFLATPERLCWKNLLEHPRQLAWREIDPSTVAAEEGCVDIAGGTMIVGDEIALKVAEFLRDVASRKAHVEGGPYRAGASSEAENDPTNVSHFVTIARRHLGEVEDLFYHPAIPLAKMRRARTTHARHLGSEEVIAVLYDDTLFGSAEDGLVLTAERLCWKGLGSRRRAHARRWSEIDPMFVVANGNLLHIDAKTALHFSGRPELPASLAALMTEVLGGA